MRQKRRGRWRHDKANVLQWHVVLECKLGAGRAQQQPSTRRQRVLHLHGEPEATAQPAGPAAEAMLKGSLKIKCLSGWEGTIISSLCCDWWLAKHRLGGFLFFFLGAVFWFTACWAWANIFCWLKPHGNAGATARLHCLPPAGVSAPYNAGQQNTAFYREST